ncbi:MAG: uracil-DNA glycosylase [Pseudomonadota bacterium]
MSAETEQDGIAARALLQWYAEMGVDEATAADPTNYLHEAPLDETPQNPAASHSSPFPSPLSTGSDRGQRRPPPAPENPFRAKAQGADSDGPKQTQNGGMAAVQPADEAIEDARKAASACDTLAALRDAVLAFEGCALKKGARNTVFADGVENPGLLVIGEAPGRDEDRIGKPFVGRAGSLLDKMLGAIGRSRENDTLISNVVFWRPPGNRSPTDVETAICRPFVERLIIISKPKAIILAGASPMKAMLGVTGIMRTRGRWRDIALEGCEPIPAMPIFHPAFLLRRPEQKRLAWTDLQAVDALLTAS